MLVADPPHAKCAGSRQEKSKSEELSATSAPAPAQSPMDVNAQDVSEDKAAYRRRKGVDPTAPHNTQL